MAKVETDAGELARLTRDYREYASYEHGGYGSPIYCVIWTGLADDPAVGGLALAAQPAFRTPLILPAAVHHLLLTGLEHRLGDYYPSVASADARPIDEGLYPAFADFVKAHRDVVLQLVRTRTTQTNEAGRSVLLVPPLGLIAADVGRPLALLEAGCSAGLNLLLDRYRFRIGSRLLGAAASAVHLVCDVRGDLAPPVPDRLPAVEWRAGIDLNPLDVRRPDSVEWLRALIWPEHTDRMATLDAAVSVARQDPPRLDRGDLVDDIALLANDVPLDLALVFTHTWVLTYVKPDRRHAFVAALRAIANARREPVWLISCEGESVLASLDVGVGEMSPDGSHDAFLIALHRFGQDGGSWHRVLAECHAHGRWIRWLDPDSAGAA